MSNDVLIMNKGQMEALRKEFLARASQIQELRAGLGGTIDGTTWDGNRARKFRDLWHSEFRPNLDKLEAALQENSTFIGKELANAVTAMDS